ncbi:MAG: MCP four helix bundle domain-containing protein [Bacteroidota bacterium]
MSDCIHSKKAMIDKASHNTPMALSTDIRRINDSLSRLMIAYEKTKLTKEEAMSLKSLKRHLHSLNELEQSYLNRMKQELPANDLKPEIGNLTAQVSANLHDLSSIQLIVGKDMNDQSQKILSQSSIFSQFAVVLLLVVGLISQMLIFNTGEMRTKEVSNVRWN